MAGGQIDLPVLNPELLQALQRISESGTPILLFSHESVGGFVTSPDEAFSKFVAQKLNLEKPVSLLAINTKVQDPRIVAHELVHLRDHKDGTTQTLKQELDLALKAVSPSVKQDLKELVTHYILEYRAENETLFHGKDMWVIQENYEYHSYIMAAAQPPNEIFWAVRNKLTKSLAHQFLAIIHKAICGNKFIGR